MIMRFIFAAVLNALLACAGHAQASCALPCTINLPPVFTATQPGLVPAPGSVSGNFLGDDGAFHPPPAGGGGGSSPPPKCILSVTASGGALTGAINNTPCGVTFPDGSIGQASSPISLTIGAGSTLGFVNNVPGRLWWPVFNNGGLLALGVIKATTSAQFYRINEDDPQASTACNGCATANSAGVLYAASVQIAPIVVLGFSTWETGMVTPGNWTAPTTVRQRGIGTPMPGNTMGDLVAGNCPIGAPPTNNDHSSFVPTQAIATIKLDSAANYVSIHYKGEQGTSSASDSAITGVLRGGTLTGPETNFYPGSTAGASASVTVEQWVLDFPQTSAPTPYAVGLRNSGNAATASFGGRTSQGYCFINLRQVQG